MRYVFKLVLLLTLSCTIFGCAHNYYNIPQETLEKKVKVLGVAPFFTDADSDIRHPDKEGVVTLIRGLNAKNEKELIARIRALGIYYSVRPVDADATRLFSSVVANKERRDDAGIIYNKYFYKKDEVRQLIADNGLDAIMFVTVSGLTRPGKVYASNLLSYLETDYNYLSMTAQIVDRDGNTIWEYPNFRRSALSYPLFFELQYPDFDEAAANLSEKVDVKFKTLPGIKAAFAKTEPSIAGNGPQVSTVYVKQYDEMISLLKTHKPLFGGKKETTSAPVPTVAPVTAPAPVSIEPATPARRAVKEAPAAPAVTAPVTEPQAAPAVPSGDIVPEQPSTGEIVPEQAPAK